MSCDIGIVMERLENELCYDYNYELCSFSNLSVTSPTSQLILQPFHCFAYITTHSPTLLLLHLHHNSFSNRSFASPTSQDFHLCHLVSPCTVDNSTNSHWANRVAYLVKLSTPVFRKFLTAADCTVHKLLTMCSALTLSR